MDRDAVVELVRPDVSGAVWDMMALRAAIGFAVFHFGFSLRSDGESAWLLGAVLVANGTGGFTGTIVSPMLRRHLSERSMFTASLVGAALATALCGIAFDRWTLIGSVFVLGLAVSVGRRALDATIQRLAPHARRGQVYASLETRLELAWVLAACLAVAVRVDTWVGVLALAAFLAVVAAAHVKRTQFVGVLRPIGVVSLADRLLMRAETLAERGYHDEALILARAAIEAARWPIEHRDDDTELGAAIAIERARQTIDDSRESHPPSRRE
jgi:MFS family permease